MKLKELPEERDELRRYDELTEWKENFSNMVSLPLSMVPPHCIVGLLLPPHIKRIIVNALEVEIKKLKETEI